MHSSKPIPFRTILLAYFRARWFWGILFAMQIMLLFLIYGLYGLEDAPAIYTACVFCTVTLLFSVVDGRGYAKRIRSLERLRTQVRNVLDQTAVTLDPSKESYHLFDYAPKAMNLKEQLYGEVISLLERLWQQTAHQAKQVQSDTIQYYTIWSHQAKTPLAAMRLLLQEDTMDRSTLKLELFKAEQYVDMALQYQRLNSLNNDLLLRTYSLEALVKQAVKQVSTLFIHKKIGIEIGPLSGTILTDQKWLVFVLEQILTNAVKYTPHGSVHVWNEADTLFVRDTGIGIHAEDLPRIFEWGYTGYHGHNQHRSTGIGLNLCQKTLTMLGHTISIESQPGNGTTVTLHLGRECVGVE